MKKNLVLVMACSMLALTACGAQVDEAAVADSVAEEAVNAGAQELVTSVSNDLFAIEIPEEFADQYVAEKVDDKTITIYYKELKESIDRGMLFSITAIELPNAEIGGTHTKIGELTTADGKGYAIALGYPSEAQWDIDNDEQCPEGYDKFYNAIDDIVKNNISGVNGGTFVYRGGCDGSELYADILEQYRTAANEGWDPSEYEENDMSPEVAVIVQNDGLDKVGYAFVDTNLDGIDELVIGDLRDNEIKGAVYDIYTMVNGAPTHVISGSARDRYYIYTSFIVNEASAGALESYQTLYCLEPNSTELSLQWATKYDGYENEDQPWFLCYRDEEWENITEEDYNNRIVDPSNYSVLDFKPFTRPLYKNVTK